MASALEMLDDKSLSNEGRLKESYQFYEVIGLSIKPDEQSTYSAIHRDSKFIYVVSDDIKRPIEMQANDACSRLEIKFSLDRDRFLEDIQILETELTSKVINRCIDYLKNWQVINYSVESIGPLLNKKPQSSWDGTKQSVNSAMKGTFCTKLAIVKDELPKIDITLFNLNSK